MNSKVSNEVLMNEYRKIEHYIHTLPCGCGETVSNTENSDSTPTVHPNLYEVLDSTSPTSKMNLLDTKRQKKIRHNLESIKGWISRGIDLDETKQIEIIKELNKIARAFRQMAIDVSRIYKTIREK